MPDLTISTGGGDATIGGDVTGRDKHTTTRVSSDEGPTRNEYAAAMQDIGKLQSDVMNIRLELAAERGRKTLSMAITIVWPIVVGAIVLFVAVLTQ